MHVWKYSREPKFYLLKTISHNEWPDQVIAHMYAWSTPVNYQLHVNPSLNFDKL